MEAHWTRSANSNTERLHIFSHVCVCSERFFNKASKSESGFVCWKVSARSWDHNEFFAQFSGDHTLLAQGYSVLLHKLGEGLDICTNCPVCHFQLLHLPM